MSIPSLIDEAEIAVVGAGPAGTAAAMALVRLGHEVILIDKSQFPRDKPCGDGLTISAVAYLERLGLDGLIEGGQPIEGTRVVIDHSWEELKVAKPQPGRPHYGRCIPRLELDKTLLDQAMASGARFRKGRVDGLVLDGNTISAVVLWDGKSLQHVQAKYFIAADGVTSQMRSKLEPTTGNRGITAYAIRQYFSTEKPLDPVFDFYLPLELYGRVFVGYGWIFPISAQVANIGVGYFRGGGLTAPRSLRKVLDSFVRELKLKENGRLGEITELGSPLGSPLGINFQTRRCQLKNVLFVGDAALTTDPLIGEGISYALKGAEMAAVELHNAIRQSAHPRWKDSLLDKRFPRLGQDPAMILRAYDRLLNKSRRQGDIGEELETTGKPFLRSLARLAMTNEENPVFLDTPAGQTAAHCGVKAQRALQRLNHMALSTLRIDFPFTFELLIREIRAGAGPVVATTLLLCMASLGAQLKRDSISAALAAELLGFFPSLISRLCNRARDRRAKLNNALGVMVVDYALSHALEAAATLGPIATANFAKATRRMCEGTILGVTHLLDPSFTQKHYLAAAEYRTGTCFSLAVWMGSTLAGANQRTRTALYAYGLRLGVAFQIVADLQGLLCGDEITGRKPGDDLCEGVITLPVIHAAENNNQMRELLSRSISRDELDEILASIKKTNGIERAIEECERHADRAKMQLVEVESLDPRPLKALADLAVNLAHKYAGQGSAEPFIPAG